MKQNHPNLNSYLYINESSILYLVNDKYYELKLNKNILNNGAIVNKDRFILEYNQFIKKKHLKKFNWHKKLKIIYIAEISKNDLNVIKYTFDELGYRKTEYISDRSLLKLNKKDAYLVVGKTLRLYYIDKYNQKRVVLIDEKVYDEREICYLIKNKTLKKDLIIINDTKRIIDLVKKVSKNYYYYIDKSNYFLKKIKNEI